MESFPIKSMIDFLHVYRSQELQRLRERHPTQSDLFKPGRQLGEHEAHETAVADSALQAKIDIVITSMKSVLAKTDEAVDQIRQRLVLAKILRNVSAGLALLTGAALIGLILASQKAAIVVACINLVASLLTLIAGSLETPPIGGQKGLLEYHKELVETGIKCKILLPQILPYQSSTHAPSNKDECDKLIAEAGILTNTMTQILHNHGGLSVPKFAS